MQLYKPISFPCLIIEPLKKINTRFVLLNYDSTLMYDQNEVTVLFEKIANVPKFTFATIACMFLIPACVVFIFQT